MKVLSITEPFATLIKENIKTIETRSFKTNYRGELYIHASLTKNTLKNKPPEFTSLIKDLKTSPGYILCKCTLSDCIYMTDSYIENIKKNKKEYLCGRYEVGRYVWVLKDIKPLITPVKAKGALGIWNYYTPNETMNLMENIEYGWVDKNNQKHKIDYETFSDDYRLQSPQEVIKSKLGVCWDQTELERYYLNSALNIKTYFICHYDNKNCPSHTFLTYEIDNKHYWFEHSWQIYKGIHEYNTKEELLKSVRDKFIKTELNGIYEEKNLLLREYSKPKYNISVMEFYEHCEKNNPIILKE